MCPFLASCNTQNANVSVGKPLDQIRTWKPARYPAPYATPCRQLLPVQLVACCKSCPLESVELLALVAACPLTPRSSRKAVVVPTRGPIKVYCCERRGKQHSQRTQVLRDVYGFAARPYVAWVDAQASSPDSERWSRFPLLPQLAVTKEAPNCRGQGLIRATTL